MRDYRPYIGRNPKSGEKIQVKSKTLPFFKSGKDMRDRVNGKSR
jgi:integration host factor subunit beta